MSPYESCTGPRRLTRSQPSNGSIPLFRVYSCPVVHTFMRDRSVYLELRLSHRDGRITLRDEHDTRKRL